MNCESVRHYIKKHYPFISIRVEKGNVFISSDPADPKIICEPHGVVGYKVVEYRQENQAYLPGRWYPAQQQQLNNFLLEYTITFVEGNPYSFFSSDPHIPAGWKKGSYVFIEGILKPDVPIRSFKKCAYAVTGTKIEILCMQSNTRLLSTQDVFELGMLVGARADNAAIQKARNCGIQADDITDIIKEFQK